MTPPASDLLLQLQQCLETELGLVRQFMLALQAEALALTEPNDNDALNASTGEKNRYAEQLSQTAQTRHALLGQLGYSADKSGLDAAAAAHPELGAVCQPLYEQTRQASDLNTANGAIINTFIEHNQRALDTLQYLIGQSSLYDASGRTKTQPSGHKKSIKAG